VEDRLLHDFLGPFLVDATPSSDGIAQRCVDANKLLSIALPGTLQNA
jgi:hypothetical protein